eukprot:TRINITY_DN1139_c0_g2_i4.p4 TRINITY_DN1139_c0_g2~~TRINITY_DN1139_c0_g2_i4.p4  ORF type:complete len:119 (+),score=31.73 TRINITY_DN1139_c0_g2_i4:157-513(+)
MCIRDRYMGMADRKAVIKNADMAEDMQSDAVDCANQALEKFNIEKDIAAFIKKEFDKKYNPTWHCVVGRNFGSYVTLSLIHISEPTRQAEISYAVFCLKKKKKQIDDRIKKSNTPDNI